MPVSRPVPRLDGIDPTAPVGAIRGILAHFANKRKSHRAASVGVDAFAKMQLAAPILGAAIFVAGSAAAVAQQPGDCAFVSRLAGSWTGRGSLQRSASAEPEPVRCRLRFDWRPSTRIMTSTMDCRGIDLDFKLWGSISVSVSGGKLKGAFFGSEGITNVTANGSCRTHALALQLKEIKPKAGAPVSRDLTISLSEDGGTLSNLLEMRDPVSGRNWRSMSISFKR